MYGIVQAQLNFPLPPFPYLPALPSGSYTGSCINIVWTNNNINLTGSCQNGAGTMVPTTLSYGTLCAVGSTVANINGALQCDTLREV